MNFRGLLVILLLIAALLYYFGKPQQWWNEMNRTAKQVHALPDADSAP
jgi:hypothetical protein